MEYMYRMIVYNLDGELFHTERSHNIERFERYKNKENYRIVIKKGRKVLYSEI